MRKLRIETMLDEDTVKRIDNLIENKKYDSRSGFIRRAVLNEIERSDKPILA